MPDRTLKSIAGGKQRPKTSTCVSCDDEGRIGEYDDQEKLRYTFCWCDIGQDLKKRYCEEKQCNG